MGIRINKLSLFRTDLRARMPFRYGIATMDSLPHVLLRALIEVDGKQTTGFTADHLPPKWFKKDPDQDPADEIEELLLVVRTAMETASRLTAPSLFHLWRQLYDEQNAWGNKTALPPLLSHFGTALVERALIDAVCRQARMPLAEAVSKNLFGIDLGNIHAPLTGTVPSDWLPEQPVERAVVRHTVGLGDPLHTAEIAGEERLDDGLPQALDEVIRVHGVRHFKIKITAPAQSAVERLKRIAPVIEELLGERFAFTLDGNEGFSRPEEFLDFVRRLRSTPSLESFLPRLLFIEQPFPRNLSLAPEIGKTLADLPADFPVIIDESDATFESLPAALELGYAGTSHKNCKGVFKGIANACLLARRRNQQPGKPALLSGEDLTTIPPFSLQQDLAVQALLGNQSIERNGHHYLAGLSGFPKDVAEAVLASHPDLYHRQRAGFPALYIEDGELDLHSCNSAPFGTNVELNLERHFVPVAQTAPGSCET